MVGFSPFLLIIFTVYVICQAGGIPEKEKQRNAPIQYSVIRVNVEVNVDHAHRFQSILPLLSMIIATRREHKNGKYIISNKIVNVKQYIDKTLPVKTL